MSRKYDHENRPYHHKNSKDYDHKKYSKSLILLKSTVFGLFIVFVTLLAAFLIIRNNKQQDLSTDKCDKNQVIKISNSVEQMTVQNGIVTIITKSDEAGKQELVRLDGSCGTEIARFTLQHETIR